MLMVGFTFITTIIISFRRTNTQKSFIRDAFGQYLSNDVINELLDNPDKFKLGGENRDVTAFFTDVKGFSTIAEQLNPSDLVNLLNVYLTGMSDTVMRIPGDYR
jgi:adenylate cyclase